MSFKLKTLALASLLCFASSSGAFAAETPPKAAPIDAATQKVINALQDSGQLDAALDRAVERRIARDQKARQQQQDEMLKEAAVKAVKARPFSATKDHYQGSATAPVSLIVYSDLECPYCKVFNPTPEAAIKSFGGKVNIVWRHFPLPMHGEVARKEAVAAECVSKQAGNDGFFKFISAVFDKTALNGRGLPKGDEDIIALAKEAGVKNNAAFDACMVDPATLAFIDEEFKDASNAGVRGTPGVLIRVNKTGVTVPLPGAVPQAQVEAVLKDALAGQGAFSTTKAAKK